MGKIKVDVSDKILKKLPLEQEKLEEVLKLGLKQYKVRYKMKKNNIVRETFGAIPIKDHDLIEKVREQARYGE